MNPWAVVIIVIALLLFIIAWKGTQDNVIAAVLGRPYGKATLGQGTSGNGSGGFNPSGVAGAGPAGLTNAPVVTPGSALLT